MLAELRNVSMKKRDIFSYFRVGGTTEAINSTVNEFIDCYQLITCSGHPKASKKSSGVLLCGGCMVAPLSSRPKRMVCGFRAPFFNPAVRPKTASMESQPYTA